MAHRLKYCLAGLFFLGICSTCDIEIEGIPASGFIKEEVLAEDNTESSSSSSDPEEVPAGDNTESSPSSSDPEEVPAGDNTESSPSSTDPEEASGGDNTESSPSSTDPEEASGGDSANSSSPQSDTNQGELQSRQNEIIALGDVHGDFPALIRCLQLGGAIDENNRWIGGQMTVVQLGDMLDRGPEDRKVLDFLLNLQSQARDASGQVVMLNGNHEIFNLIFDPSYVHASAWDDFQDIEYDHSDPFLLKFFEYQRARWAAFIPGKHYALKLSTLPIIYVKDEVVFVHGSLFPEHVRYGISKINEEMRLWMEGKTDEPKWTASSLLWDRTYSLNPTASACAQLDTTLSLIPARMLVVAHTVHLEGITSACNEKVWRVDVGMSEYYGGTPSVLKISGEQIQILK